MKTKIITILILVFTISVKAYIKPDDSLKIKDLPLVITNATVQDKDAPLAFFISGDGGWYHFEQTIANNLAKKGIPTIGLDSRKYFWKRRTPEETTSEMAEALAYYAKLWKKDKFVLMGYSLGAEIVPFIVNRLPNEIKLRVEATVLLSPDVTTDFEIHVTNMLGIGNKQNTYETIPELLKMQDIPTLLIFGDGEKTKVPGLLSGTSMKIIKIPGDHHYKSNLPLIMQTISDNTVL
jgi:type IV secretory pathway VirJ component